MPLTPPPPPSPSFHAELLPNIRSITLSITVPTPCTSSTTLTLKTPTLLEFVHDGITTPIPLPAAAAQINLGTTMGAKSLSYRLPVASAASPQQHQQAENYVPWSASVLVKAAAGKCVTMMCKACSCLILDGKAIKSWKDLPSGNWAEMMEFWHCHKPGPERKTDGSDGAENGAPNNTNSTANGVNGSRKVTSNGTLNTANAASSTDSVSSANGVSSADATRNSVLKSTLNTTSNSVSNGAHPATTNGDGGKYRGLQGGFKAEAGTVLVDLTYFLVAQTDCEGVQSVEAPPYGSTLICTNCKSHLGSTDASTGSYTLNKWKLKLSLSAHGIQSEYSYPLEPFIAASLLALAEGEGIRRMLISTSTAAPVSDSASFPTASVDAAPERRLKLWLFSADVRYTSDTVGRPMRAVKVFYAHNDQQDGQRQQQQQQQQQQQKQGSSMGSGGFEEVKLGREMVAGLKARLEEGVGAVEGFGGWNVGYLMRFERERENGASVCSC